MNKYAAMVFDSDDFSGYTIKLVAPNRESTVSSYIPREKLSVALLAASKIIDKHSGEENTDFDVEEYTLDKFLDTQRNV